MAATDFNPEFERLGAYTAPVPASITNDEDLLDAEEEALPPRQDKQ